MATIAAGMESDSDSECDIVFSSKDDTKPNRSAPKYSQNKENSNNSSGYIFRVENVTKTDKNAMIPASVIKKTAFTNNTRSRPRAHRNRTLVFDDLRYAILQGNLEETKNLYENNAIHADTILKSGWTGLMFACNISHGDIVEYLLQKGADPNFHHDMFTPLMAVCISNKDEENLLKCCSLLLQYKAQVNVHERHHTTPLIFAAREGHTKIVKLLLENGAEPDVADSRGYTAIAWAAFFGHGQVIRVLLEKGADKNKTNNMGQLPADIAFDQGFPEVASVLQKIHAVSNEESVKTLASSLPNMNNKTSNGITPNSFIDRNFQNSKQYSKVGELELFLIGIGCPDLVEKFKEHHLSFHDLLIMDDAELEKIGIYQVGLRNKILEACKRTHKTEWKNSSIPNLKRNQYISCPDAVSMVANISKHLKYISTSVIYIRNQIESQPRILEISKDSANVHNLIDEVEDSLKNLQCLKDEMRFLKMHLAKVQDKPEYINGDLIVETVSKNRYTKTIVTAVGITTLSVVLTGIWWKYPGILNNLPPAILVRIPFLNK